MAAPPPDAGAAEMKLLRELAALYARIGRVYISWFPTLILLAAIVFLPLGLLGALTAEIDVESLNIDSMIKVAALVGAIGAITACLVAIAIGTAIVGSIDNQDEGEDQDHAAVPVLPS